MEIKSLKFADDAPSIKSLITKWAANHQDELLENWDLIQNHKKPKIIAYLADDLPVIGRLYASPSMVASAKVTAHGIIRVTYENGMVGILNVPLENAKGVYKPLSEDFEIFAQATVTDGVLHWPDNIDFDPFLMYWEMASTGEHTPQLRF